MLKTLYFFRMPNLTAIEDCAFCGLLNLKKVGFGFCPKLFSIHENAFGGITQETALPIELIWMQYTNVSTLSEKLLNWNNVQDIIISTNPFICDCKMAWLINDISMHKFDYIPKFVYFNIFSTLNFS